MKILRRILVPRGEQAKISREFEIEGRHPHPRTVEVALKGGYITETDFVLAIRNEAIRRGGVLMK